MAPLRRKGSDLSRLWFQLSSLRFSLHLRIAEHFCDHHHSDDHGDDGEADKDGHPPLKGRFLGLIRWLSVRFNHQFLDLNGKFNLLFLFFSGFVRIGDRIEAACLSISAANLSGEHGDFAVARSAGGNIS